MFRKFRETSREEWMKKLGFQAGNPQHEQKMDFLFRAFDRLGRHQKKLIMKMSMFIEKKNSSTEEWDKQFTPFVLDQSKETFSQSEVAKLLNTQREQDISTFNTILGQQRYQQLGLLTWMSAKMEDKRHHKHIHIAPIFLVWFVTLIGMFVLRRKAKNLRKRIENLLTLENRTIFRELGYVWSINNSLTVLTLTKMNAQVQEPHNVYPQSNPFMQQAPIQQNIPHQHVAPMQYAPVNMDDSMMSARDTEYR